MFCADYSTSYPSEFLCLSCCTPTASASHTGHDVRLAGHHITELRTSHMKVGVGVGWSVGWSYPRRQTGRQADVQAANDHHHMENKLAMILSSSSHANISRQPNINSRRRRKRQHARVFVRLSFPCVARLVSSRVPCPSLPDRLFGLLL